MPNRNRWRCPTPPANLTRRTRNKATEIGMHFGGAMFFTDYSMAAMELARALEERGFESVWAPEHSHIPLSRKAPFPGGGDLPKQYYDAMDPFVVLAAASQVTRTIKLGTGVLLVQQRDAIQTAKLVARPNPVRKPHPPIHVGGVFPHGARRAIRYGDGWIPTAGRGDVAEVLPKFREMVREAGRDPASVEISLFGLREDLDQVKRFAELGVARVVPMFAPEKADTVLPIVDRWTKIMRQVNG